MPAILRHAGLILEASCPCGFNSVKVFAGGARADFKTVCKAPAHCAVCQRMPILNYQIGSAVLIFIPAVFQAV